MSKNVFQPGEVLLPNSNCDLSKWSVVACDQFTSQPEYWDEVSATVGDAPSTLKITLPEIYLESDNVDEYISKINAEMDNYVANGVLESTGSKYIYIQRTQRDGVCRHGIIGVVDLEEYNYLPGSQSLIRATEGTVLERIPPRVRVRENACLELPHIMLLIDDPDKTVIEPVKDKAHNLSCAYSFPLMQDSGSIKGYFVDESTAKTIDGAIQALADPEIFEKKYGSIDNGILLFAVGDGNHSLATAKECYERVKKTLSEEDAKNHPARYALVEVVNIHDPALEFEPIHRVVFDVDSKDLLASLREFYSVSEIPVEGAQEIEFCSELESGKLYITNPRSNLAVGSLQIFLDTYLKGKSARIDYIHGDDVVYDLGKQKNNIGFLLPPMEKGDLFKTVLVDGALPRKTFSMGHAWDKRFYLECRKIK